MRWALYCFGVLLVVAAAFVSYRMSYETKDRAELAERLRRDIAAEREAIAVLRAEWAYLNAPERLQALVEEHRAHLRLRPLTSSRFAELDEIDEPQPDDGLEPVTIIGLEELGPRLAVAPPPAPRPVTIRRAR